MKLRTMTPQILGAILLVGGVIVLVYVGITNFRYKARASVFSPYTVLSSSWEKYKTHFIQKDGRVIDYSQSAITTSEGQSYALLRSVWSDDKSTFDTVYTWTKSNLKRPNDQLFGWLWGKQPNGKYGFIGPGADNTASDADSDIALALILASNRWNQSAYLEDAKKILADLWKISVVTVQKKNYFSAGNWAHSGNEISLNPSYFSPYAWRFFAQYDKDRDWNSLISPAYDVLTQASHLSLDASQSAGLAPDWVMMNKDSGVLHASTNTGQRTTYSYDAVRVPWRIGLDALWFKEPRAQSYLQDSLSFLVKEYDKNKKLFSEYTHDGKPVNTYENSVMYSTFLSGLTVLDKSKADTLYRDKILKAYSSDQNSFIETLPYYEQNWLWLGSAFYLGQLTPYGMEGK